MTPFAIACLIATIFFLLCCWYARQCDKLEAERNNISRRHSEAQVEIDRLNGIIERLEAFKAKRNMSAKQRAAAKVAA